MKQSYTEQSYIQNYGQYNTIVDGNIIDNTKWNLIYNEDGLDLEASHNDELLYIKLNNDEIINLFEIHANNKPIHERLEHHLYSNSKDTDIQPIIQEIIYDKSNHTPSKKHSRSYSPSKKHTRSHSPSKKHTRSKKHSRTHSSSNKHSHKRSRSRPQSSSKKNKHSISDKHSDSHSRSITPDYLKTIY